MGFIRVRWRSVRHAVKLLCPRAVAWIPTAFLELLYLLVSYQSIQRYMTFFFLCQFFTLCLMTLNKKELLVSLKSCTTQRTHTHIHLLFIYLLIYLANIHIEKKILKADGYQNANGNYP